MRILQIGDDRCQVHFCVANRETAQTIVAAEGNDDNGSDGIGALAESRRTPSFDVLPLMPSLTTR